MKESYKNLDILLKLLDDNREQHEKSANKSRQGFNIIKRENIITHQDLIFVNRVIVRRIVFRIDAFRQGENEIWEMQNTYIGIIIK